MDNLQRDGVPTVCVELGGPVDLGPELFKWEIATALTCALLDVDLFHDPDVQGGHHQASVILESCSENHPVSVRTARVRETGIELYAEGLTRQQISTLNLSEALRTLFELRTSDGYLAMLLFVDRHPATSAAFQRVREQLASRLGIPVLLARGPGYLHYLGQLFKGGPPRGQFMFMTAQPTEDIAVPGASYTFGMLQQALAIADFEAMIHRQRPALLLHLTHGTESGLPQLEHALCQAVRHVRQ